MLGQREKGSRFTMQEKISIEDLENSIMPDSQKQEYVDAYNRNADRLISSGAVSGYGDGNLSLKLQLNESQLSAIKTADYLYDIDKLKVAIEEVDNHIIALTVGVKDKINVLTNEPELVDNISDKEQVL